MLDSDEEFNDDDDDDAEYHPEHAEPREKKPRFISLTLPCKGLLDGTAEMASRLHLSHRKTTAVAAKLVKMGVLHLRTAPFP